MFTLTACTSSFEGTLSPQGANAALGNVHIVTGLKAINGRNLHSHGATHHCRMFIVAANVELQPVLHCWKSSSIAALLEISQPALHRWKSCCIVALFEILQHHCKFCNIVTYLAASAAWLEILQSLSNHTVLLHHWES